MLTFFNLILVVAAPCWGGHIDLPRIIGGTEAPIGQWPWQGSLEINKGHNCGCVLISTRWAVTAAHCVGSSISSYTVTFGLHDRFNWNVGQPTRYSLSYVKRHEGFIEGGSFPNDVAVIQFTYNVALNAYVNTVKMAPRNKLYDDMWCWVSGWGVTTVGGGGLATRLRQAEVAIVPTSTCRNYWNVDRKHVCIGKKDERGSCNGDSGGPLVCYMADHYELVGVTSFGRIGCDPYYPSVYTSISYHRDWIYTQTGL